MSRIRFRCGGCSREFNVSADKAGSEADCPSCGAQIIVPMPKRKASQQRKASGERKRTKARPPRPKTERRSARDSIGEADILPALDDSGGDSHDAARFLASLGWLPLGLLIADGSLGISMWPLPLAILGHFVPVCVTLALIVWNAVGAVRVLLRSGRAVDALPVTVVQIGLFLVLFVQLHHHVGASTFVFEGRASLLSWFAFTIAHAVRAADLMDGLESLGISIQGIHSGSHLSAAALMVFHLMMNLFVLRLVSEAIAKWRGKEAHRTLRMSALAELLLMVIAVLALARATTSGWRLADYALWPLANAVRVLDFLDVMEIYRLRLDLVPREGIDGWLTLACRAAMTLWLSTFIALRWRRYSLANLGGRGLDESELEFVAEETSIPGYRRIALSRLKQLRKQRQTVRPIAWPNPMWTVVVFVAACFFGLAAFLVLRTSPQVVARTAVSESEARAKRAHAALRKAGPSASAAQEVFSEVWSELNDEQKIAAVQTLAEFGPAAVDTLEQVLDETGGVLGSSLTAEAIDALARFGVRGTKGLMSVLRSPNEQTRSRAEEALIALGPTATPHVLANLTEANRGRALIVLDRMDPYWPRLAGQYPLAAPLVRYREALRIARQGRDLDYSLRSDSLRELGAADAVPVVVTMYVPGAGGIPLDDVFDIVMESDPAASPLRTAGSYAHPVLEAMLWKQYQEREWAAELLLAEFRDGRQHPLLEKKIDDVVAYLIDRVKRNREAEVMPDLLALGPLARDAFVAQFPEINKFDQEDFFEEIDKQGAEGERFLTLCGRELWPVLEKIADGYDSDALLAGRILSRLQAAEQRRLAAATPESTAGVDSTSVPEPEPEPEPTPTPVVVTPMPLPEPMPEPKPEPPVVAEVVPKPLAGVTRNGERVDVAADEAFGGPLAFCHACDDERRGIVGVEGSTELIEVDLVSLAELRRFQLPFEVGEWTRAVLSANGELFVARLPDGSLRVLTLPRVGEVNTVGEQTLLEELDVQAGFDVDEDGQLVAIVERPAGQPLRLRRASLTRSRSGSGFVVEWTLDVTLNQSSLRTLLHTRIRPDGRQVLAFGSRLKPILIKSSDEETWDELEEPPRTPTAAAFTPLGARVAVGHTAGVTFFYTNDGDDGGKYEVEQRRSRFFPVELSYRADGKRLAICDRSGEITILNTERAYAHEVERSVRENATGIAFIGFTDRLLVWGEDGFQLEGDLAPVVPESTQRIWDRLRER